MPPATGWLRPKEPCTQSGRRYRPSGLSYQNGLGHLAQRPVWNRPWVRAAHLTEVTSGRPFQTHDRPTAALARAGAPPWAPGGAGSRAMGGDGDSR
jgi:hypothetical protein